MSTASQSLEALAAGLRRIPDGGGIIALLSGAPGPDHGELATRCEDTQQLENLDREMLCEHDSTILDLFLDDADLGDRMVSKRRISSVGSLQLEALRANNPVEVWLSLPVDIQGLAPKAMDEVLRVLEGSMSNELIWMRMGITSAIGQNGQGIESLTLGDVEELRRFADQTGMGHFPSWTQNIALSRFESPHREPGYRAKMILKDLAKYFP